ncbi:hypothetical protein CDL12_10462 [Handroanthus impetiginosus]|uniref:Uncharacterized protein n=1 Tax=Handroanthus impetiginosus TaxID=429701 RepID=A0A2G9HH50_9LAMI|nr:hypothetical protein CDL12_10462 [Handroanthus impetiginosus]
MGNWNRRYLPRKKFRHYDYDDPPLSPPRPDNPHSGFEDNGVPSWEIEYCKSVRVPWHKVLASKKYIYCHPRVQNWDDSAGKEAFQNAKQRYWAMINGLPSDNPLPDPDIYVDEIDWNSYTDPQLMADLDLQDFDPDKLQTVEKLETISEEAECAQTQDDKNQPINDNPWERSIANATGSLKDVVQGWGRWDDSEDPKNDNPWEQSCSQPVDSLKDNAWRSGNESWGWSHGNTNAEGSKNSGNCGYFCENYYSKSSKEKDWRDKRDESWGWKNSKNESWGSRNNKNESWALRDNKNESWVSRDNMNESQGWRQSGYQSNEQKYWDSRSFRRGGCRKRESSLQHTSKHKSSRCHGSNYVDNRQL